MAAETKGKRPADHKPKAVPSLAPATEVTVTVADREWTVDLVSLTDWDAMDDIGEVDAGNYTRMPRVLRTLLGPEQYALARPLFIGESGRADLMKGVDFTVALFRAAQEAGHPNPGGSQD